MIRAPRRRAIRGTDLATASSAGQAKLGGTIVALTAVDGTAGAPWARHLDASGTLLRDLADAVHSLCALHGGMPGIIDHAHDAGRIEDAQAWLDVAAEAFAIERALLATLTAAVGPLPSTPGQAASEAAVIAQRQALAMLARSDRAGCAIGAAVAFIIDWHSIRQVLDVTALRVGVSAPALTLARPAASLAMLDSLMTTPGIERAIAFGAQQMLAQHRGLWQLLDARASARRSL